MTALALPALDFLPVSSSTASMAPSHTGIWAKTLVDTLQQQGISPASIVGNSGIDITVLRGDEPKMPFDQLARLFERAAEITGDDLIGFRHGQNFEFRQGGLVAYTGLSSPKVSTLLKNLGRYQRMIGDAIEINVSQLDSDGLLKWHFDAPRGVMRRQYVEFGGAGIIKVLRQSTGRNLTPVEVHFRHFRKSNARAIAQYFGCPVAFGSGENRFLLKSKDLDLPLTTSDDYLYRMLLKFSEEALQKHGDKKPSLHTAVETCIASRPTRSQAEVARELGMSARTLSRRLSEAGTTFFTIVENYREALSRSMLCDSDLHVTEIAYVLGYADLSTFSTAFKRWTSKTPTEYRDHFAT